MILDEPTAALDVSAQVTILKLLAELRAKLGTSYLFVSHDLNVVRRLCNRVAVMHLGRIVETGPAEAVFRNPRHPYTRPLIAAAPALDSVRRAVPLLPGKPCSPVNLSPTLHAFHGRCPVGAAQCLETRPTLRRMEAGWEAACHLAIPSSPHLPGVVVATPV